MKPDLLLMAFDLSVNVLPLYAVEHADSLVCFCFGRPNTEYSLYLELLE